MRFIPWLLALSFAFGIPSSGQETHNDQDRARTLHKTGDDQVARGDYAGAVESFQQSLAIVTASGDNAEMASLIEGIGRAYFQMTSYARALELCM